MPNIQDVGVIFAICATLASMLYTYLKTQHSDEERITALELRFEAYAVKIDTTWDFLIRRSIAEATAKGLGTLNSPLIIDDEARALFSEPLQNSLRAWFEALARPNISDRDLFIEIERVFGDQILQEVCNPNKLNSGECILIAVSIVRGGTALQMEFPSAIGGMTDTPPMDKRAASAKVAKDKHSKLR